MQVSSLHIYFIEYNINLEDYFDFLFSQNIFSLSYFLALLLFKNEKWWSYFGQESFPFWLQLVINNNKKLIYRRGTKERIYIK